MQPHTGTASARPVRLVKLQEEKSSEGPTSDLCQQYAHKTPPGERPCLFRNTEVF